MVAAAAGAPKGGREGLPAGGTSAAVVDTLVARGVTG
jgi:hypothetical protein